MTSKPQSERIDKTEPALVVRHGNTAKRHFTLGRSGVALGRAHGCDVQLDSPEVSGLHCIFTRAPGEVVVRDCNSRVGTRVNGIKVKEARLNNGDVVQIGTFSFDVYLPWALVPQSESREALNLHKRRIDVLERSRVRLAHLALKLRRRVRDLEAAGSQEDTKEIIARAARSTQIDRPAETTSERVAAQV
jgi:pSer/pThr/pTyr-binding forkhead associated (FHA) protein